MRGYAEASGQGDELGGARRRLVAAIASSARHEQVPVTSKAVTARTITNEVLWQLFERLGVANRSTP
jgi:hypothetical protein